LKLKDFDLIRVSDTRLQADVETSAFLRQRVTRVYDDYLGIGKKPRRRSTREEWRHIGKVRHGVPSTTAFDVVYVRDLALHRLWSGDALRIEEREIVVPRGFEHLARLGITRVLLTRARFAPVVKETIALELNEPTLGVVPVPAAEIRLTLY